MYMYPLVSVPHLVPPTSSLPPIMQLLLAACRPRHMLPSALPHTCSRWHPPSTTAIYLCPLPQICCCLLPPPSAAVDSLPHQGHLLPPACCRLPNLLLLTIEDFSSTQLSFVPLLNRCCLPPSPYARLLPFCSHPHLPHAALARLPFFVASSPLIGSYPPPHPLSLIPWSPQLVSSAPLPTYCYLLPLHLQPFVPSFSPAAGRLIHSPSTYAAIYPLSTS